MTHGSNPRQPSCHLSVRIEYTDLVLPYLRAQYGEAVAPHNYSAKAQFFLIRIKFNASSRIEVSF